MIQRTKHQIIDETVEYYSKNPRAVADSGCHYLTDDGRVCAHSRCCRPELRKELKGVATMLIREYGDSIHQAEYKGHESAFWTEIQRLHDCHSFWDGNELTAEGLGFVVEIKKLYA